MFRYHNDVRNPAIWTAGGPDLLEDPLAFGLSPLRRDHVPSIAFPSSRRLSTNHEIRSYVQLTGPSDSSCNSLQDTKIAGKLTRC